MPERNYPIHQHSSAEEAGLGESNLPAGFRLMLLEGTGGPGSKTGRRGTSGKLLGEKEIYQRCGLPLCSDRMAALLAGYFRRSLSRVESAELVGLLAFPQSREGAELFGREMLQLNSDSDRRQLQLFARNAICARNGSEMDPEEEKYALALQRRRGMIALVSLENEVHRSGLIESLSRNNELSALFAVNDKELRKTLRLLPPQEFRYRRSVCGRDEDQQRFSSLLHSVRQEIARDRLQRSGELRSDTALAREFGLDPIVVFHYLMEGLSPAELAWRDEVLRLKLGEDAHRRSLMEFVRQELRAFDEYGSIDLLSSTRLAALFGTTRARVERMIEHPQSGLAEKDLRFRDYVLRNQSPRDPFSEALRQMRLIQIREIVARGLTGAAPVEERTGQIEYRGLRFCSFAEAACGLMLEKYLQGAGFKLIEGETFQIQIGKYSVDFLVKTPSQQVFVEFHPILMKRALPKAGLGGFGTYDEYQALKNSLPESRRADFARQVQEMLYREYTKRRQDVVDESSDYSGTPLRTVTCARDLYYFLKYCFDVPLPAEVEFLREFSTLRRHIIRSQGPLAGAQAKAA